MHKQMVLPVNASPPTYSLHFPSPRLSSHSFPVLLSSFYLLFFSMPPWSTKTHKKAPGTEGKKTGRKCKKTAAALASEAQPEATSEDEPEDDAVPKAPARVVWDKYPVRTERLLDYLDAHPDVAIRLFGDSTKVAKLEGRSKVTAKSNKATAYMQLADGVFSVDDDTTIRADFAANPNKYAKAVDNYITNT